MSFITLLPVILRVARVCGDILLMVGISRSGLATVLQTFAGGALWAAPQRPYPSAPAHHGIPKCQRSWGTSILCREKPRRPFQTNRISTSHFRPVHRGHEDSYRRLRTWGGPCSQGQKSEWPASGVHTPMMNARVVEFFPQDKMGGNINQKSAWELRLK